ncbi:MAG: hypothetical protein B7Z66_02305 [Chromatiales bacterium 21-64-14]|nr:MAG: hypothetical protein B7Z66_02305 [Chromatiales bacterium 21-64-14]
MIRETTLAALQEAQALTGALVESLSDHDYRHQFHPGLSPLGWHVGHCAYTESYWLREVILSDDRSTAALHDLYVPERIPKPLRGPRLPPLPQLLRWTHDLQRENLALLRSPPRAMAQHRLLRNEYLPWFLIQHYSQHFETMQMILAQRSGQTPPSGKLAPGHFAARTIAARAVALTKGDYIIGSDGSPAAYDNELPSHRVTVGPVCMAPRLISNAEYLGFIDADGYRRPELWSAEGWRWLGEQPLRHPEYWRASADGGWYGVDGAGYHDLSADAPVCGISRHEAVAFARWAGARLPHEYEWETAQRAGILADAGAAWEWCANPFHPYPGFKAFPYEGYSTPWFDQDHYTLRGGSRYTQAPIRRPSFRNFYTPDCRYLFAGLRLAFDG